MTPGPHRPWWSPRWWPGHLIVLVLLGGAAWLGGWQFDAFQASRESEAVDLTHRDPVPVAEAIGPDQPFPADQVGQPVVLHGRWLPEATVYVRRDAGYWVVTPLAVAGSGDVAMPVVRGLSDTPQAPPVSGDAELVGWLQPPEGTGDVDEDPTDDVLPQLRVADLVQRVSVDLYGGYAVATEPTAGLSPARLEQLPDAGRFTGLRNFFYALEWWVFGGFAVFIWVRHLRDEQSIAADDPAGVSPAPSPDPRQRHTKRSP